jgi:hypothetical protein
MATIGLFIEYPVIVDKVTNMLVIWPLTHDKKGNIDVVNDKRTIDSIVNSYFEQVQFRDIHNSIKR